MSRPRVLLLAEAANPEWTSVPLLGWFNARAIAAITDAHLVTQVRNRDSIVRAGLVEGRDFTAIDSEAASKWLWRMATMLRGGDNKGWTTVTALSTLSNYYYERLVWKRFGDRIKAGEFDIVHRITPSSPTTPSLLAGRCKGAGVPFIVGPLNGGLPWPPQFSSVRHAEREWLSYIRRAYRLLPGYRSTLRHSSLLLVGSQETLRQIPDDFKAKCVYMPENGVDATRFSLRRTRQAALPLRLVFVGRLVPYKGADMLLEAAAPGIRSGHLEVEIIGDGPEMPKLRELVTRLNIADGVELPGWLDQSQLGARMVQADLFAFPSIREFGGAVILEAMAVGLPAAVVNYGGPGELVDDDTGFRIDLGTREDIIGRFQSLFSRLVADPGIIDAKGTVATRRIQDNFTWEERARRIVGLYESLLPAQLVSQATESALI